MTLTSAQQAAADALDAAAAAVRALANDPVPVPAPLSFSKGDAATEKRHAYRTDKAKLGDLIRIVSVNGRNGIARPGDPVGEEKRVMDFPGGYNGYLIVEGGWGIDAYDIVSRADEKPTAKVGDRVKILEVKPWVKYSGGSSIGKEGYVTAIGNRSLNGVTGIDVMIDGKSTPNTVGKVEVINPKVGDRVTVTEVALAYMQERNGFTGTIQEVRLDGKYLVAFDGYRMRGMTIVATKVSPLAADAPTNPSQPEPVKVAPEPAPEPENLFEIFDGDTFTVEYEGRGYGSAVTLRVNDGVRVYADTGEVYDLIRYLQTVVAYRKSE